MCSVFGVYCNANTKSCNLVRKFFKREWITLLAQQHRTRILRDGKDQVIIYATAVNSRGPHGFEC